MLTEIWKRIDEHSENFNKHVGNMKKNQSEMRNKMTEMRNTLEGIKIDLQLYLPFTSSESRVSCSGIAIIG